MCMCPSPAPTVPSPALGLQCKLWESAGKRGCVCKMPFSCEWVLLLVSRQTEGLITIKSLTCRVYVSLPCRASLQLCAQVGAGRPRLLEVCQLGALRCQGRSFTLASDSECNWPEEASCKDCTPGTVCQGRSQENSPSYSWWSVGGSRWSNWTFRCSQQRSHGKNKSSCWSNLTLLLEDDANDWENQHITGVLAVLEDDLCF